MKNLVHLKNYLTKEIQPQENYQLFILRELLVSGGQATYDDLVVKYKNLYEDKDSIDLKAVLKNNPTKALLNKGFIKSENESISLTIKLNPDYYKSSILWILDKSLAHWNEFGTTENLKFKEGIFKSDEDINKFCSEKNVPKKLVQQIILSINRGEKQLILDGPPGTGKTYIIREIIKFLGNDKSISDLVQFHPSYGYEEFIEGLRPSSSENGLEFKVVPGKLKNLIKNSQGSFPITKELGNLKSVTSAKESPEDFHTNNFYLVTQGGSYEVAKKNNNIWAPNKNARGAEQIDWSLLKQLKVGDYIFHYADKHIRAIGKVMNNPKLNIPRPYSQDDLKNREEKIYLSWENNEEEIGTLVDVMYFELSNPVNKDEFCGELTIEENKRTKNSAFDRNGNISQKYLSTVSTTFVEHMDKNFNEISSIIKESQTHSEEHLINDFSDEEILTEINVNNLPESPGVHVIFYKDELLYVGETADTRRRITEHLRSHSASGDTFIKQSQLKFNLDFTLESDQKAFEEIKSKMKIRYKVTSEKEELKNKLIDSLNPEFNKKLASVKNDFQGNSWIKLSEDEIVKFVDYSVFKHNTSTIPKEFYSFFSLKDIDEKLEIEIKDINNKTYKSHIRTATKSRNNSPAKLIKWNRDFTNFLKLNIPTWESIEKGKTQNKYGLVFKLGSSKNSFSAFIRTFETDHSNPIYSILNQGENNNYESFGSYDFLIIDEINRGNLPKIFGELLNTFEYRDEPISLQYSDEPLSVPTNLIFLGTMNSTDKSVGRIDAALRRRLDFIHVAPNYEVLENYYIPRQNNVPNLVDGLKNLNKVLLSKLSKHCLIGHTFFMKSKDSPFTFNDLEKIWDRKIYPLLIEYFLDDPIELEPFSSFENFWTIEEPVNEVTNTSKVFSIELLGKDLEEIDLKLRIEFEKIINWSSRYEEFNIYLGRRVKSTFKTGGGTFIFQNNLSKINNEPRNNKYHFFRITGKGKYELRLQDLYSEKFTRAPFDSMEFRSEFEEKFKNICTLNNIEIEDTFFEKFLPGISLEDIAEKECGDMFLEFWDWVIDKIREANN